MEFFAKIRLYDSHYCGLFKLTKLELGGVSTDIYVWKLYGKTDKIKREQSNVLHLRKTEAQQFNLNHVMHFSFVESDLAVPGAK